jgi:hypothetical protein
MATTTKAARYTKGKDRFYHIDGRQLPSVTTILSCLSKPALVNWAGKLTRERMCDEAADFYALGAQLSRDGFRSELWKRVEKRVFQNEAAREAADLGTLAHARCEWVIQKRLGRPVGPDPVTSDTTLTPADRERALWASLSFEDWMAKNDVQPMQTEIVVHHPDHHYAGTADLVARVNGVISLVDLKTSSGLWPEMYLQVAAYRAAYNSEAQSNFQAVTAHLVRLPKKITDPEFEAVEVANLDSHLEGFLSLFSVWKWMQEVTK